MILETKIQHITTLFFTGIHAHRHIIYIFIYTIVVEMQSMVSTQLRIIVGMSATSRPRQQNKRSLVSRINSSSGTSSTSSSSSSSDEEKAQFMLTEYGHPWIENEESAMRLLEYLRTKEKREFNLEKARVVIAQIRETHEKGMATEEARKANPFKLPKTFPGFLGILERSSDKI